MLQLLGQRKRWMAAWAVAVAASVVALGAAYKYSQHVRSNQRTTQWVLGHCGMIGYDVGILGSLNLAPVYTGRVSEITLNFDSHPDLSPLSGAPHLRKLTVCVPDDIPLDLSFAMRLPHLEVLEIQASQLTGALGLKEHPSLATLELYRQSWGNSDLDELRVAATGISITVCDDYHQLNRPFP